MSLNLKQHMPILELLKIAPDKFRNLIINNADDKLVLAIAEICLNFCKGNVKCDRACYKRLKKYKSKIHKVARIQRSNTSLKRRRAILTQKGGAFLPILLAPVLSSLAEYFLRKAFD